MNEYTIWIWSGLHHKWERAHKIESNSRSKVTQEVYNLSNATGNAYRVTLEGAK